MPPTYKRKEPRIAAVSSEDSGLPQLTPKQEAFVQGLLQGKSNLEAYKAAYEHNGGKESSITVEACKLRRHPKIEQALRFFQRIGIENASITRESHLTELARGREIAYTLGQASAGIQAEHYRGRVAGLYNDKLTLAIGPSDEMLLAQISQLLGPELAKSLAQAMGTELPSEETTLLSLPSPIETDSHN